MLYVLQVLLRFSARFFSTSGVVIIILLSLLGGKSWIFSREVMRYSTLCESVALFAAVLFETFCWPCFVYRGVVYTVRGRVFVSKGCCKRPLLLSVSLPCHLPRFLLPLCREKKCMSEDESGMSKLTCPRYVDLAGKYRTSVHFVERYVRVRCVLCGRVTLQRVETIVRLAKGFPPLPRNFLFLWISNPALSPPPMIYKRVASIFFYCWESSRCTSNSQCL